MDDKAFMNSKTYDLNLVFHKKMKWLHASIFY